MVDILVQLRILLSLDLVNVTKCLRQHSKDQIKQEEGSEDDKHDREDDGHPLDVRVHQVVHDLGPALQGDHLEDSDQRDGQVVKHSDSVVDIL